MQVLVEPRPTISPVLLSILTVVDVSNDGHVPDVVLLVLLGTWHQQVSA